MSAMTFLEILLGFQAPLSRQTFETDPDSPQLRSVSCSELQSIRCVGAETAGVGTHPSEVHKSWTERRPFPPLSHALSPTGCRKKASNSFSNHHYNARVQRNSGPRALNHFVHFLKSPKVGAD